MFEPLAPLFNWLGDVLGWVGDMFGSLFEPINATEEELEGFRSTGQSVGQIVGKIFRLALLPLTAVIEGVGSVLKWLGVLDDTEVKATIKAVEDRQEKTPASRPSPLGRIAKAGVVGATLATTPVAADTPSPPAFPTTPVTEQVIGKPGSALPAVDADEIRDQVRRDLAGAGLQQPDEEEDSPALRRVEAYLAAQATRDAEAPAGPGQGFGVDRALGPPQVHQVFHNTFHIYGSGEEQFDELERRVVEIMRRAGGGTGLEEDEDRLP